MRLVDEGGPYGVRANQAQLSDYADTVAHVSISEPSAGKPTALKTEAGMVFFLCVGQVISGLFAPLDCPR